ncbi:hypothetical protein [Nitrosovibrio sp. Nv6]|uniref:hypothetical protein n=1 Tax=Nitrosovibrio sp. Nv6 TaxID=1855340 RepID=UPI0008AC6DF6|nr:hypothetical protein [Nitrosovibrio sp. Nv6]SEO78015.1 hypothetical protein SAMN05216316_1076 [Nitrosovibrio sp. Nv6]
MNPFSAQAKTLPITVTATASISTALPSKGNSVRIINEGPSAVFVSIGSGTQAATLPDTTPTSTSTPVLNGSDIVLSIPSDQVYNISAICRSGGSATISVQVGEGL